MAYPTIGGVQFEWNEEKAAFNWDKHRIRFAVAARAFFDLDACIEPSDSAEGELRFQLIGLVDGQLLLFVAYTERKSNGQETIRIISARKASSHERRRYFAAR